MEIKIGVQHSGRELILESTQSADEVLQAVTDAIKDGSLLSLIDEKGRRVVVPADRIAYLEIGASDGRKIGFGG
jgi:predicted PilT family ATPase